MKFKRTNYESPSTTTILWWSTRQFNTSGTGKTTPHASTTKTITPHVRVVKRPNGTRNAQHGAGTRKTTRADHSKRYGITIRSTNFPLTARSDTFAAGTEWALFAALFPARFGCSGAAWLALEAYRTKCAGRLRLCCIAHAHTHTHTHTNLPVCVSSDVQQGWTMLHCSTGSRYGCVTVRYALQRI